ncbi:hypothetical protein MMC06_006669 [Schaereria dolodes]|nr:hypothetical protein [Schaereria dolodes]
MRPRSSCPSYRVLHLQQPRKSGLHASYGGNLATRKHNAFSQGKVRQDLYSFGPVEEQRRGILSTTGSDGMTQSAQVVSRAQTPTSSRTPSSPASTSFVNISGPHVRTSASRGAVGDISLLGPGQESSHTAEAFVDDFAFRNGFSLAEEAVTAPRRNLAESVAKSSMANFYEDSINDSQHGISETYRSRPSPLDPMQTLMTSDCASSNGATLPLRDHSEEVILKSSEILLRPVVDGYVQPCVDAVSVTQSEHNKQCKSERYLSRPAIVDQNSQEDYLLYNRAENTRVADIMSIELERGSHLGHTESTDCGKVSFNFPPFTVDHTIKHLEAASAHALPPTPTINASNSAFSSLPTPSFTTTSKSSIPHLNNTKLEQVNACQKRKLTKPHKSSTHTTEGMPKRLFRHSNYTTPPLEEDESVRSSTPLISAKLATYAMHSLSSTFSPTILSLLRDRELGGRHFHSSNTIQNRLQQHIDKGMTYWRSWTGASKDVIAAAWASDSSTFAFGAATDLDDRSIQYNRGNNLLLGDLISNTLTELPDHYKDRPRPESISGRSNAQLSTYNTLDPKLYTTVTSVCFSAQGERMFSGSYDKTIKIWDVSNPRQCKCFESLTHDAEIDLLAISPIYDNILASGQHTTDGSIRVYELDVNTPEEGAGSSAVFHRLSSHRAEKYNLFPSALQWGHTSMTANLLLVGFADTNDNHNALGHEGELCLWDIETSTPLKLSPCSQSVFDVTWHPTYPILAAASTPGLRYDLTNRYTTRSLVRTYRPLQSPSRIEEYECPALDINDVRFNPVRDDYISAGCTDGVTYVWDHRMPDRILHQLSHSQPIDESDEFRLREEQDTGIRLTLWDQAGSRLYTGSSDGAIRCWDIFRSPDDALIREVAQFNAGIMCGAFSPDYTNLLVGLSNGEVEILSCARLTQPSNHDKLDHDYLDGPYEMIIHVPAHQPPPEVEITGVQTGRELISTLQLEVHPIYGAGKGPEYNGPYAQWARTTEANAENEDLRPDILAGQLDPLERKKGRKAGGRSTKAEKDSYKAQAKLAHERNYLRFRNRAGHNLPWVQEEEADAGHERRGQRSSADVASRRHKSSRAKKAVQNYLTTTSRNVEAALDIAGTKEMPIVLDRDEDEDEDEGSHQVSKTHRRRQSIVLSDGSEKDGEKSAGTGRPAVVGKGAQKQKARWADESWKGDWAGCDTDDLLEDDHWQPYWD